MMDRRRFLQGAAGGCLVGTLPLHASDGSLLEKTIPGTIESLPAIGIGTNRFVVGDVSLHTQLSRTLQRFYQLGGRLIDTAPMYRSSETALGKMIDDLEYQQRFFLATKSDRDFADGGMERVENSFTQLRSETIDLMQIHNLRGLDMLPRLREMQAIDRIRYLGITTSRPQQFEQFIRVMETEKLDFIQVNYSLGDREAAERILPLAQDKGLGVLVNVPLGRGKLFAAVKGRSLPGWASELGAYTWAQLFLKYVISHPAVTCAIPGMRVIAHVEDNLKAATGPMPDAAQRTQIERWFDRV